MTRSKGVLAFDLDVTMMWLHDRDATGTEEPDAEVTGLNELVSQASHVLIVPTIVKELEARGISPSSMSESVVTIVDDGDEGFLGCAKGRAERYVDRHPDPRDCRVIAEAECAHADIFVTLNTPLIAALDGRTDRITIARPSTASKTCLGRNSRARTTAPEHR